MTIKELHEQKGSLVKEIRTLADKSNDKDHVWSGENEQEWQRVNDALDALQVTIDAEEASTARADRASALEDTLRDVRGIGREDRVGNQGGYTACTDEHRNLALQAWMRSQNGLDLTDKHEEACQLTGLNPRRKHIDIRLGSYPNSTPPAWNRSGKPMVENRAGLVVGTTTLGGFTIPKAFSDELEQAMVAFNGPRQVCRVIRTDTGNQIEWPTVTDTGNTGVLLSEATTIGTSVDPTFGQKLLNAYKYSSKALLVSEELMEDSAFNMSSLIASLLGERLGRIQAAQFTTGTGSAQPNGVVTASTAGKTTAASALITADEIMDLVHSVDPAYRTGPSVGFMFHDSILKLIRKLKTTDLQYLWQPGFQVGAADQILGYPFTINQNMNGAPATTVKTMLFGDFSKFIIRDVANLRLHRLEERYRDLDQTGFIAFMRSDSECVQPLAINHMVQV